MTQPTSQTDTTDRELRISRLIEGPRDLVFSAFTDPENIGRWWGPDGFTTTTRSFEFRLGGEWDYVMHGPDGTDYPNWVRFDSIEAPARIEYLHGESADDPAPFHAVVTFQEQDGGTLVTLCNIFATREQRELVEREFHAVEGGQQTLGRLAAYVATLRDQQ
ncbi:MAG: SRPBCC family protein [Dehalococcoidia bacterium]|nr:SRPBCC family protein [Dehalococcoidia bacterium]